MAWTAPKIALLLSRAPKAAPWKEPTQANPQTARMTNTSPRQLSSMEKGGYGH